MDYYQTTSGLGVASIFAGMSALLFLLPLVSIFLIVCQWIIYKKAGKNGWESIIPVYNLIVLFDIVGLPKWYIVLLIVPIANIYVLIRTYIELAHKFGKSTGFGLGLTFFNVIFIPILAFDKKAIYEGSEFVAYKNNNEPITQPEPIMQPEPITQSEPITQPEPIVDEFEQSFEEEPSNTKICPVCGNTIGAELTTCVMCGNKLD